MLIIMSVLGAVVMPHNLFLHSEVIQSREWNLEDESVIKKQLKYEFYDTLLSMVIGWAINSAMIILAASTFFKQNIAVDELDQAQQLLVPLVGNNAGVIFAAALLLVSPRPSHPVSPGLPSSPDSMARRTIIPTSTQSWESCYRSSPPWPSYS